MLTAAVVVVYLMLYSTFDWVGAALAVAEVPQELVDTIVAEGAGQGGELHLLVTEKEKIYLFI